MAKSKITWHIKEKEDILPVDKEFFAGSYNPGDIEAVFRVQIWNNKWGEDNVDDVVSPVLALAFDTIEDNSLLNYCKVRVDGGYEQDLDILGEKGFVKLNRTISGKNNKGGNGDVENYVDLTITFGPISHNMKNGLKGLLLNLQGND